MHLVGFIRRIYHDARSPERQKYRLYLCAGVFNFKETYKVNLRLIISRYFQDIKHMTKIFLEVE